MNRPFVAMAALASALALFLPTRSQRFTRVAIDGRTTRMLVAGSGESTVVFENGLRAPLEMWGKVQPRVSRFARTVTYDRAGAGLSDDAPPPRDGRHIATELRRALRVAGVPPPYVLVGASLGGLYVRIFAGMYPEEVSGIVLVDPTHDAKGLEHSILPELEVLAETVEQARASQIPPGVPLVLIDAISSRDVPFATDAIRHLRAQQRPAIDAESRAYEQWLNSVPGARLVITDQSGHNLPIEQPELVVETIRQVVQSAPEAGAAKSTRTLGAGRPFAWNTVARSVEPLTDAWIDAFTGASTAVTNRRARSRSRRAHSKRVVSRGANRYERGLEHGANVKGIAGRPAA
jgi:pimeloyl-ACP methyl ester carboxylesterase